MTEHEVIVDQIYWISLIAIPVLFGGFIAYRINLSRKLRKKAVQQLQSQDGKCYQCGIRINEKADAIVYGNFKEDRHAYCSNCKSGVEI